MLLNVALYIHTFSVLSNLYLDIYFTPQRTQCYSIKKTHPTDYPKDCTKNINTVHQNVLFHC